MLLTKYYEGDLIKVEMCGVCDLHEGEEILVEKSEGKRPF
jgi:hypothetical protein